MNLIINPIGISIIKNHIRGNEKLTSEFENIKQKKVIKDINDPEVLEFKKKIQKEIESKNLPLEDLSAETNSLLQMKNEELINPAEDKLVLLYSDTIEGEVAAKLVRDFINNNKELNFENKNITLNKLQKITANDANAFGEGLKELRNEIKNYLNTPYDLVIYNVTAGYKGLIPALTIFSINNNRTNYVLCYIYERTEKLVKFKFLNGRIELELNNQKVEIEDLI